MTFGLQAAWPTVDRDRSTTTDGVRCGSTHCHARTRRTATSARCTRGRRAQFAVRILGVTGRTRVLRSSIREPAMDSALTERRSEPRQPAKALDIAAPTLRPDAWFAVLDVSANGAHVQSERPLRPWESGSCRLAARTWTLAVAGRRDPLAAWALAGGLP